jgi:hypothetical protein
MLFCDDAPLANKSTGSWRSHSSWLGRDVTVYNLLNQILQVNDSKARTCTIPTRLKEKREKTYRLINWQDLVIRWRRCLSWNWSSWLKINYRSDLFQILTLIYFALWFVQEKIGMMHWELLLMEHHDFHSRHWSELLCFRPDNKQLGAYLSDMHYVVCWYVQFSVSGLWSIVAIFWNWKVGFESCRKIYKISSALLFG